MPRLANKIGIFEEAKEFNLRIWETPSFLFLIMGVVTIILMIFTYLLTARFGEPEIIIFSEFIVTLVLLVIGTLLVNGVSKMIIVNRANTDFVSMASHQFRTPLAGVKWSVRALLDGDAGELSPRQKNLLVKTYESNERMVVLTSNLLNISRIEAEKFAYKFSSEDILEIINEVIGDLSFEASENQVSVILIKPEKELSRVRIDRIKIKMVIQNVLDNAIRYNIPGGKVEVSSLLRNGFVEIRIKDTGIGIPKHQIKHLFSRFFKGDNAVKSGKIIGSGLGLYLSRKIIERHKGRIWAESEENRGSIFHITLPI